MQTTIERQHSRVSVPISVILDCTSGRREVRVADLSVGGCYVDTIVAINAEDPVGLKFLLPNSGIVEIPGTVAYVHNGIGFGVQFTDMTREQRSALETVILMNGGAL